jgi:hypothetical protein
MRVPGGEMATWAETEAQVVGWLAGAGLPLVRSPSVAGGWFGRLAAGSAMLPTMLLFREVDEQIVLYLHAPVAAPANRRLAVAELLTRINRGIRLGCFELDFADGDVRYRVAIDVEGVEVTPALIRNLTGPALPTMDRFLPALFAVAFADVDPVRALAAVGARQG